MNEILEHCLYESGLTADGCWNELDDYAKESIERFAELIVIECASICYNSSLKDPDAHAQNLMFHFNIDYCRNDK